MASGAGEKKYYNAEGRRWLKQSNGEDSTTGSSGSSPDLHPTPDLSALEVSHFCWLPTEFLNFEDLPGGVNRDIMLYLSITYVAVVNAPLCLIFPALM